MEFEMPYFTTSGDPSTIAPNHRAESGWTLSFCSCSRLDGEVNSAGVVDVGGSGWGVLDRGVKDEEGGRVWVPGGRDAGVGVVERETLRWGFRMSLPRYTGSLSDNSVYITMSSALKNISSRLVMASSVVELCI